MIFPAFFCFLLFFGAMFPWLDGFSACFFFEASCARAWWDGCGLEAALACAASVTALGLVARANSSALRVMDDVVDAAAPGVPFDGFAVSDEAVAEAAGAGPADAAAMG